MNLNKGKSKLTIWQYIWKIFGKTVFQEHLKMANIVLEFAKKTFFYNTNIYNKNRMQCTK